MTPFARFLAFEAIGWLLAGALLAWLVQAGYTPAWVALLLFAIWVAKDFALFPLTRHAYEDGHPHGAAELLGSEVRVETPLGPGTHTGYVRAGTERWRARLADGCTATLEPGGAARVCALQGITLIVEPWGER